MSLLDLIGYVIGAFIWIIDHHTIGNKIVALDGYGEAVEVLKVWEDDENDEP